MIVNSQDASVNYKTRDLTENLVQTHNAFKIGQFAFTNGIFSIPIYEED